MGIPVLNLFSKLLKVRPQQVPARSHLSLAGINQMVFINQDGQKLLNKTVETKIVLQEIKGTNNTGCYFSITDKAPDPGEYRYMTRGGIGVGNLLLSVTVLHRVKDSEAVKEALSILREAKQVSK